MHSDEDIFSFRNLLHAYRACLRRKSRTINAIKFGYDLERNLAKLVEELGTRTYRPGRSICFITQEPVIREIFAADFRDRVVQHLLMREIEDVFEKRFVFDSFACRKGKGTVFGTRRLRNGIRSVTDNFRTEAFYFKADISSFFMSIDKGILFEMLETTLRKKASRDKNLAAKLPDILWLARTIIFHDPTKNYIRKGNPDLFQIVPKRKSLFYSGKSKGLPIGNLTSQFFANVYLDELDQFVKHTLKCRHYYRYVDDFVLLEKNKEMLTEWRDRIETFLHERLGLALHPKKQTLQSLLHGIDYSFRSRAKRFPRFSRAFRIR